MKIRYWHMLLGLFAASVLHLGAGLIFEFQSVTTENVSKISSTRSIAVSLSSDENSSVRNESTVEETKAIEPAQPVELKSRKQAAETPVVKPRPAQEPKPVKTAKPVIQPLNHGTVITKPFVAAKPVDMEKIPPSTPNREQTSAGKPNAFSVQNNNSNGPSVATGSTDQKANYLRVLGAWLELHKQYPRRARIRRQEGTVVLRFILDREGRVTYYKIEESSGHGILDKEVEAMIKRAQPLPKMPEDLQLASLELVVPVQFSLR